MNAPHVGDQVSLEALSASTGDITREAPLAMLLLHEPCPGERLNEAHLAERLGLSRTPLREALNRLAPERLLAARGVQGFFVGGLDLRKARALRDLRAVLEAAAFRLAWSGPRPMPSPPSAAPGARTRLSLIPHRRNP